MTIERLSPEFGDPLQDLQDKANLIINRLHQFETDPLIRRYPWSVNVSETVEKGATIYYLGERKIGMSLYITDSQSPESSIVTHTISGRIRKNFRRIRTDATVRRTNNGLLEVTATMGRRIGKKTSENPGKYSGNLHFPHFDTVIDQLTNQPYK